MKRFLIAVLAATTLPAQADIKYTQEMRMPAQGNKAFSKTTVYKRPGAERVESSYQIGTMEQRSVTLTVCAKKEMYTLDPSLKMYYATPLVKVAAAATKAPKADAKSGTFTMTLISLKDVGGETIGTTKTRCYEVVTRMQASGCMGNSDMTTKQHLCISAAATPIGGDGGCTDMMPSSSGGAADSCKTVFIRKGDWARYDKLTRGVQVRAILCRCDQ